MYKLVQKLLQTPSINYRPAVSQKVIATLTSAYLISLKFFKYGTKIVANSKNRRSICARDV